MIKVVVFDFGGVLVNVPYRELLLALEEDQVKAIEQVIAQLDVGAISLDQAWFRAGQVMSVSAQVVRDLIWDNLKLNEAMKQLIDERLWRRVKLALLSNISAEFLREALDRCELAYLFDAVIASSDLKVAKPDPAMFLAMLKVLRCQAQEVVFVDDSPANVAAAAKLGMTALHFRSAAKLAVQLDQLGLVTTGK